MCKEGTSLWTKQQREAKKAKEELLNAVAAGEVPADEIQTRLDQIEDARVAVYAHPVGVETLEEALALSEGGAGSVREYCTVNVGRCTSIRWTCVSIPVLKLALFADVEK